MSFLASDHGQGLVEYALILMMVAIVVLLVLGVLGTGVGNLFSNMFQHTWHP